VGFDFIEDILDLDAADESKLSELDAALQYFTELQDTIQWKKADFVLKVYARFGKEGLKTVASTTGLAVSSLYQMVKVANTFPPDRRLRMLSWRHHVIAAYSDDPYSWLEKAHDEGWSTSELERNIARSKGGSLSSVELCRKYIHRIMAMTNSREVAEQIKDDVDRLVEVIDRALQR